MTVPPEAVDAAAKLLTNSKHAWIPPRTDEIAADRATVVRLLAVAAPLIAAAERDRIRRRAGAARITLAAVSDGGAVEAVRWSVLRDLLGGDPPPGFHADAANAGSAARAAAAKADGTADAA